MNISRREQNRDRWMSYLRDRVGTYEYRTLRFAAVYDELVKLGLQPHDMIVDVGAGMCDFARYAYSTRAFDGRYLPVDGSIDGTDLELWEPKVSAEFFVSIETVEHLEDPAARRLLAEMQANATKGVVITTPNPVVWNSLVGSVANLDPTHHTNFSEDELVDLGFKTHTEMLFGQPDDTIIGVYAA